MPFRENLSDLGKAAYDKLSDLGKQKAEKAYRFISLLRHTKGEWAGKLWQWIPWQEEAVITFFGTLNAEGFRVYRILYIEVPKKNGKTELVAAILLYCLYADDEPGVEAYSAAGDIKQASLTFNCAAQMVRTNETLDTITKIIDSQKRMAVHKSNSFYAALSSESYTKHGLNPHAIGIDELHAHPTRDLYDVLTEGTDVARRQQVVAIITTAGVYDPKSVGYQVAQYARQVLSGIVNDPTLLPIIYAANKDEDDWEDEEVWKRVNPSVGYIFDIASLRQHYEEIKANSARVNNFLRFRLNMWVGQVSRYIPMDAWSKCDEKFDVEALKGRTCYGGLDLSSTQDLTAFVLVFPPKAAGEKWKVVPHVFIPEDTILQRSKAEKVDYLRWKEQGYVTATPGGSIDYSFIHKAILDAAETYDLKEVAYDPWNATETATYLREQHGINMLECRQGFKTMSEPTKKLLRHILEGKIAHAGHPVLRFCADNLVVQTDAHENVKPAKDKSVERIDAVVALAMSLGRALIFHKEIDPDRVPITIIDAE